MYIIDKILTYIHDMYCECVVEAVCGISIAPFLSPQLKMLLDYKAGNAHTVHLYVYKATIHPTCTV